MHIANILKIGRKQRLVIFSGHFSHRSMRLQSIHERVVVEHVQYAVDLVLALQVHVHSLQLFEDCADMIKVKVVWHYPRKGGLATPSRLSNLSLSWDVQWLVEGLYRPCCVHVVDDFFTVSCNAW